jgi:hypothetical protein
MSADSRLPILAVVHLILGGDTGALASVELRTPFGLGKILIVPFFASALCQAFLLSVCGAVSQAQPWVRLAGLVTVAVYLEALIAFGLREHILGLSTFTIVVTTATLLVVRWLGIKFTRQDEPGQSAQPQPDGLRFSIRGLMIFTAAVAFLCAGARALRATPTHLLLLIFVWALCFVAVGLVSLWAALGDAHPLGRAPVVFVLSPVLGAFFAFAVGAHPAGWIFSVLIMLLYPAALLGSLLVVRSCGYRLVRRAVPSTIIR